MPAADDKATDKADPVSEPPLADVEHDEEHSENEHVEAPDNGSCTRRPIRGGNNE